MREDRNFKASDVSGPSIWIFILWPQQFKFQLNILYLLYFMIQYKNNKYLRIFIINHNNTINIIYLVYTSLLANKRFVKISPPPVKWPQGIFVKIAHDFQIICFYSYPEFVIGGFFLSSATNVFIFRLGLFYNEVLLDTEI
jgi:hypothetical protein